MFLLVTYFGFYDFGHDAVDVELHHDGAQVHDAVDFCESVIAAKKFV